MKLMPRCRPPLLLPHKTMGLLAAHVCVISAHAGPSLVEAGAGGNGVLSFSRRIATQDTPYPKGVPLHSTCLEPCSSRRPEPVATAGNSIALPVIRSMGRRKIARGLGDFRFLVAIPGFALRDSERFEAPETTGP